MSEWKAHVSHLDSRASVSKINSRVDFNTYSKDLMSPYSWQLDKAMPNALEVQQLQWMVPTYFVQTKCLASAIP